MSGQFSRWSRVSLLVALALAGVARAQAPPTATPESPPPVNPGLGPAPPQVSRDTAARSWGSFLTLGGEGRFALAAHLLDLREVPAAQQPEVGARVAHQLFEVAGALHLGPGAVSAEAPVAASDEVQARDAALVHRFTRSGLSGEILLRRQIDPETAQPVWLVGKETVSSVSFWYDLVVRRQAPVSTSELNPGLGSPPSDVQRGTPRRALAGFLAAANAGRFAEAAHYLDLTGIPVGNQPVEGARLSRRLLLVVIRGGLVDAEALSDEPFGVPEEGLPDDEELVGVVSPAGRTIQITLQQHWTADRGPEWTFSRDSVAQADRIFRSSGLGWLADHLPTFLVTRGFAGLQLWQWIAVLLVAVVGFGVARVVGHWLALAAKAMAARTRVTWDDALVATADGPLGIMVWALLVGLLSPLVGLNPAALKVTTLGWQLIALVGVAWLFLRLTDVLAEHLREAGATNAMVLSFVPLVRQIGKFFLAVMFLLAALDIVGVNVVALLAGVGIGGVAIAFAAQKTLENLFGAVTIAGDKPFAVGDFVQVGQLMGTVEGIGLRSVRLRTVERTLVTVPNSTVVAADVVNLAERDRMLYNPVIGVVYGTSAEQIRFITDEVQRLLLSHPRVWQDALRCRFRGFGASSLDIEVFAWLETRDFVEFTALREELNYRVMEIVERAGTSFAFPSQTLYLARDGAPDPELRRAAEEEVRRRSEAGELAVPEPSPELKERLHRAREDARGESLPDPPGDAGAR